MVTAIRKGARAHLYVREWIEHLGLSDEKVALRIGVARETVYRWRTQQRRLTPAKIMELAEALNIQPEDLWHQPGRRSVDAILKNADDGQHSAVLDFVERMVARRA